MSPQPPRPDEPRDAPPSHWFNRSTLGISLASLFSDVSHEIGTAVLPTLLLSIGAGPAALGLVEGLADGLASIAKLWGGVVTDRIHRRKRLASVGYLVTAAGMAAIGLCTRSWQVLACRVVAWVGRGSRSAPRDVLMAEAVPAGARGRAFGMERAADATGAVVGPLLALLLLTRGGASPSRIIIGSLLPGLAAFLAIVVLVRERSHLPVPRSGGIRAGLTALGAPFHRILAGIFLFGCGDFSRTLLILHATRHMTGRLFSLEAAAGAIALYVLHNAVSAAAAFPLGALADRIGRRVVLVGGYALAAATTAAFAWTPASAGILVVLFIASGLAIASEEVTEKATAVDLLPRDHRGTGLGLLAAVNGVGDMLSSTMVGLLWSLFPAAPAVGFLAAAAAQLAGTALVLFGGARKPADERP